jgi:TolB-like protein
LVSSQSFREGYANKWQSNKSSNSSTLTESFRGKNINHYARGLMQDLIGNLQYVNSATPVAVSSFVYLDSTFNDAPLLGNQLAESLIHEVHKLGIPVLDVKSTGFIRVTQHGDLTLSKDYLDLTPELPIRYVVTGTLVKHQDGVLVNARIIGIDSKAVVASAQGFIPEFVVDDLETHSLSDGIPLVDN